MGIDTIELLALSVEHDPTLVPKVLDMTDRIGARQAARTDSNGCLACEFLLQVCDDPAEIVCKVCGRDDWIIDKLGGNDLELEDDKDSE